ncbi:MAG: hypothetical protein ABFD97_16085 [Syntrophobacter sp.]
MHDIRYVCLSDTHFGAETSLLTHLTSDGHIDPAMPSPVLERLVDCLRSLIPKKKPSPLPTLVMNGDILELALAQDNDAAMAFQRFIELTMLQGDPLFEKIIYNPGNHDHHLWETARETQFAEYLKDKVAWGDKIDPAWHTTNIFRNPVESYFLNSLLKRRAELAKLPIVTTYPNFGIMTDDLKKAVVFHHGHLVEDLYYLMSTLKTLIFPGSAVPTAIWDIEAENFAWIDFFWSALGRSSAVGIGVGRIYEKLQDEDQVNLLLKNLADGLARNYGGSGRLADWTEAQALKLIFDLIYHHVSSLERHTPGEPLSESAKEALKKYMSGPLKHQIHNELGFTPEDITFVFGHTHKPFEDSRTFENYHGPVQVYNSGGWVVDKVDSEPVFGGAIILIDETLETVSLRMYNEQTEPRLYAVSVNHAGAAPGAFHKRIAGLVQPNAGAWKAFSETVADHVSLRAHFLADRIRDRDK